MTTMVYTGSIYLLLLLLIAVLLFILALFLFSQQQQQQQPPAKARAATAAVPATTTTCPAGLPPPPGYSFDDPDVPGIPGEIRPGKCSENYRQVPAAGETINSVLQHCDSNGHWQPGSCVTCVADEDDDVEANPPCLETSCPIKVDVAAGAPNAAPMVLIDGVKAYYRDQGVTSLQEFVDRVSELTSNPTHTVWRGYKLEDFWDTLTVATTFKGTPACFGQNTLLDPQYATGWCLWYESGPLYIGTTVEQAIITVTAMLSSFCHESDRFRTCDEYIQGGGQKCNQGPHSGQPHTGCCGVGGHYGGKLGYDTVGSKSCHYETDVYPDWGGCGSCRQCNLVTSKAFSAGNSPAGPTGDHMEATPGTATEGCAWWGRGPLQITGRRNMRRMNSLLFNQRSILGDVAEAPIQDLFCSADKDGVCADPDLICVPDAATTNGYKYVWLNVFSYWYQMVQNAATLKDGFVQYYTPAMVKFTDETQSNPDKPPSLESLMAPYSYCAGINNAIFNGNWTGPLLSEERAEFFLASFKALGFFLEKSTRQFHGTCLA